MEEGHRSTTAATGTPMYTQKAGLIFGGNPAKDKSHGLPLCWVAYGGVLWCPRMLPYKEDGMPGWWPWAVAVLPQALPEAPVGVSPAQRVLIVLNWSDVLTAVRER